MNRFFCKWIYSILIVLTIYTDSPLQGRFESFGESLLPTMSIMLTCILYPMGLLRNSNRFINRFGWLIVYTLAISVVALILFSAAGNLTIRGEFLPIKTIKVMLYFVGYLSYLLLLYNLSLKLSITEMLKPFLWTFILLTIILFIEIQQIPNAFAFLHHDFHPYWRVRLFAKESSWTASLIQVFFTVSLYYTIYLKKSLPLSVLVICSVVLHIIFSGSKTLQASLFMFVLFATPLFLKGKKVMVKVTTITLGITLLGFLVFFILPKLSASAANDMEGYTSTVTRTYTMLCGYGIGIVFPFGTGFPSFIEILPYVMKNNTWVVDYFFPNGNLSEVLLLTNGSTEKALSAKSFMGQSTIYWGLLGSLYFLWLLYKCYKEAEHNFSVEGFWLLKCMFLLMIVELLFTSGLSYEFLAFIAVILSVSHKRKRIRSMKIVFTTKRLLQYLKS